VAEAGFTIQFLEVECKNFLFLLYAPGFLKIFPCWCDFMRKYRSRLEIIADILEIVKDGSKKTHIMFQANLSYRLLCRYLNKVIAAGLVKSDVYSPNYYFLTDKGEEFLKRFREYFERKKGLEKKIELITEEKNALEKAFL